MKILHIYKTYYPDTFGGIEQVINSLVTQSLNLGVDAHVLVLSPNIVADEFIEVNGISVHRVKTTLEIASSPFSISLFFRFANIAKQYDLLHYHFPWPFADLLHLLFSAKKPAVVTYHSDIVKQKKMKVLYAPLMRWFLGKVDCIVPSCAGYLNSSQVLQPFRDKCQIIPFGLNPNSYPKANAQKIAEYHAKYGERYFVFIGVFRYYKGLDFLLQAAKDVAANIVLVGDGGLRQRYQAEAARLGLNNVHFVGQVDEQTKINLLAGSFCFVFPSHLRSEAFGIGLLEASMLGKPMISCEIGTGTSFVNLHSKTGLVIPPADSTALAIAMNQMLLEQNTTAKMGAAALTRFNQLFDAKVMAKAYVEIYQRVLEPVHNLGKRSDKLSK